MADFKSTNTTASRWMNSTAPPPSSSSTISKILMYPTSNANTSTNVLTAAAAIEDLALELGLGLGVSNVGASGAAFAGSGSHSALTLPNVPPNLSASSGISVGNTSTMLGSAVAVGSNSGLAPIMIVLAWLDEFVREMKSAAVKRSELLDKLSRKIRLYVI